MKKTLAALAVLGAFAGSAAAADVTLYGVVDLGLNYQYSKVGDADAVNTFKEQAGQNSGSRFGLKGTEDLGNGVKVGFILENGFAADDGTMSQGGRLFGREANLFVTGDFGTLSMGRVGALSAGVGSYNVVYGYTVFGTGWGDTAGAKSLFNLSDRDRMDNTVTYVTPSFAGVKVYAQYSFNRSGQEAAGNERNNDRYAALGAKYELGAFSTGLVVDTVLNRNGTDANSEDSLGVTWGASYDFGVAKVYGMAQYGKNENKMGGYSVNDVTGTIRSGNKVKFTAGEGLEGYALTLGATAPLLGGTVYAQANYFDGESSENIASAETNADGDTLTTFVKSADMKRYGAAVGYSYPFSKRTFAYSFAAYSEGKLEVTGINDHLTAETKTKKGEFGVGLVHKF
ncbi:porin [Sutterella wadsworthensis]|jgi:predicted porin|uniref:porin n=2 Tax=Sutterella wadsworthensis TaxID=40545 RepID=UPI0001F600D7|nr:porin [Sutterella wadsworthensis]EFW00669.1 hypothetical protein HMPREF9464_02243 [Sutterella wadsworthensis 3_1_45B]MBD8910923.1 porin [Sutterella wadsworthensis]